MENTKPIIELELYIIRHGQSQGNIERNTDGLSPEDFLPIREGLALEWKKQKS